MPLDFSCDVHMVGFKFDINNMNPRILPTQVSLATSVRSPSACHPRSHDALVLYLNTKIGLFCKRKHAVEIWSSSVWP